jgi:geranylgeranyl diphosphate synthase type II
VKQITFDIKNYICKKKEIIDNALDKFIPKINEYPSIIHQAIRYSIFPGGKRIRPILVLAVGDTYNKKKKDIIYAACAIELIHTYSLIHDDLPAIDNDDFRRGKPSLHKKFNEAIAILAGDALLTLSFNLLAKIEDKESAIKVIQEVSYASGTFGLIGGQVMDIAPINKRKNYSLLKYIYTHKTAALIKTAAKIGCIIANVNKRESYLIEKYGECIGFSFQILDDCADFKNKNEEEKLTFPRLYGIEKSIKKAKEFINESKRYISTIENNTILCSLADYIFESCINPLPQII